MGDLTELELTDLASGLDPNDYFVLGYRLGFRKARLEQFKHNIPGNIAGAMSSMLIRWKNGQSGPSAAIRRTLSEAFKYIERSDLADKVYKGDDVQVDSSSQPPCTHHPSEPATFFCNTCMHAACGECVAGMHNGHAFISVKKHRKQLASRLEDKLKIAQSMTSQLRDLEERFTHQDHLKSSDKSLIDSITKAFNKSTDILGQERAKFSQQVRALESSYIWKHVSSELTACISAVRNESAADEYYEHVESFETAMETIDKIYHAISEEGVLSNIDSLEVKFIANPTMSMGRLEGATGWYLEKKIDLPEDKVGQMNACTALSGRRVAVGYTTGGVDIIETDSTHRTRIADDIKILSMATMTDDRLAICNVSNELSMCSTNGDKLQNKFKSRKLSKHISLFTDSQDDIYAGYADLRLIYVFHQSGGSPFKTIKTDLEPWFISVMRSGHIVVTESQWGIKDAVQVITQDGQEVYRIPGRDGHSTFSTCDHLGNIYVALQSKDGLATIRKYSENGEYHETVVDRLYVMKGKSRLWIQLACVSPTKLVVCNQTSLYIYRRRPALTELMKLVK